MQTNSILAAAKIEHCRMYILDEWRDYLKVMRLPGIWSDGFHFPSSRKHSPNCFHCCVLYLVNFRNYHLNLTKTTEGVFFKDTDDRSRPVAYLTVVDKQPTIALGGQTPSSVKIETSSGILNPEFWDDSLCLATQIPLTVVSIPLASLKSKQQLAQCRLSVHTAALLNKLKRKFVNLLFKQGKSRPASSCHVHRRLSR